MIQLRPYQDAIRLSIYDAWRSGLRNVMAVLPCGGGKTRIVAKIVHEHNGAVCVIAHRQELVGQMSMALAQEGVRHRIIGPTALIKFIVAMQIQELGRDYYDPAARCAVAGVDTLIRRGGDLARWSQQVTLWVQDEVHHCSGVSNPADFSTGNKWAKAVAMFPNACGLGVTATPERADGKGLRRGQDGVFDHMIVGPDMREIIKMGYLTDYRVFCPPSDLDLADIATGADGDYIRGQLALKTRRSSVMGDVVNHYLRIAPGKLGVTFAPDVETASELSKRFNEAGVRAEVVSAKTPDRIRQEIIRKFRRREILQLTNCDLFGEGFDLPAIEVVSMARATQSYGLYVQQFGRACRLMDGKDRACISEGQLVLTDRGLVPIEHVSINDRLWDGVEWVPHSGAIYKGEREVITYDGLTATGDHWVKTEKGWKTFRECSAEQMAIVKTGSGGYPVRESENHFSRNPKGCSGRRASRISSLSMCYLSTTILDFIHKFKRRANTRLSELQPTGARSPLVVSPYAGSGAEVYKSEKQNVENIRCKRDTVQLRFGIIRSTMGTGKSWITKRFTNRSHRQQWSLRTRKPVLVNTVAEHVSHDKIQMVHQDTSVQDKISSCQIRGFDHKEIDSSFDRGRDCRTVAPVLLQTKRRVWDILNAGPRNCFTVSNLLVHNCVIDHVGNVVRHGLPDRPRVWSLDRREKRSSSAPADDVIPLRTCLNPACMAPYERVLTACPFCGWVPTPAGRSAPEFVDGDLCELDPATLAAMRGEVAKVDRHPDAVLRGMQQAGHAYPVAKGAANRHAERLEAQGALRDTMALWAGYQRALGRSDREGYRRFYHGFGMDVLSAQALGRAEAEALTARVLSAIERLDVEYRGAAR